MLYYLIYDIMGTEDAAMENTVVTRINSDILLKEPHGGIRFGTDALLLADFALSGTKSGLCVDLGTGSGVIPLLMLAAGSRADFLGVEIQKEYYLAASENALANGFSGRSRVVNADVGDILSFCASGSASSVVMNPPYMRVDCGRQNDDPLLSVARREIAGGASSFCRAASLCLKNGGRLFAVYRPDRIANLLCSMRENGIEPKRIRPVVPSEGKKPSLLLAEGVKGASEGVVFEKQFTIYKDGGHRAFSDGMNAVYKRFDKGE